VLRQRQVHPARQQAGLRQAARQRVRRVRAAVRGRQQQQVPEQQVAPDLARAGGASAAAARARA